MTEFKVRTNGSYEMEVMDRELSARRWLTELCFNAQKELALWHVNDCQLKQTACPCYT